MNKSTIPALIFAAFGLSTPLSLFADVRQFTYVFETDVLPKGGLEIEQYITNQSGREEGDYSAWNFRTEIEYGLTEKLQGAVYLNLDSVRSEGMPGKDDVNDFDFKGFSGELVYQILNPNLDPVGVAAYGEFTSDGLDMELEAKLLVSKPIGKWNLAFNAVYEAEWEREDSRSSREAKVLLYTGVSYKLDPQWAIGVESRNKSAYPDGLNLTGQEYQTWNVGPNVHWGSPTWWATFTVLPQVWGNGDGSQGSRQLVHEESIETRLIVGRNF